MALRDNIEYWKISLSNPEPLADEHYISYEVVATNAELIGKIERLRELIISYCVLIEKNTESVSGILRGSCPESGGNRRSVYPTV